MMKFFVKDYCETVQARVVIFGMQVDNDVLYRGIANQPSPAYYIPALRKWGIYWFTSVRHSVRPPVRPSVRPYFRNSVTLFRQRFLHNLAS